MTKVLIGSPTHLVKSYSLGAWLDALSALTYRPLEAVIVDNTQDSGIHLATIQKEIRNRAFEFSVRAIHARIDQNVHRRIAMSMEYVRGLFINSDADWYLNWECDIIPPPDAVQTMLHYAQNIDADEMWRETSFKFHEGAVDWLAAPYKQRDGLNWIFSCFGFTLFSKDLMRAISFKDAPEHISTDGWLRYSQVLPQQKWNMLDLRPDIIPLNHLAEPDGKGWNGVW